MFFVVSTGRSGSKTTAALLSLISGCICLHEPAPELILESSAYRYGTITEPELRRLLKETRSPYLNGSVYCESNQTLALIIPLLCKVFPQARYIWLMRNGLDMVASAYAKQWYSGHSENHDRYEDCPPIERAWIDGRIEGDRCGDMNRLEWLQLDRFGRCCWYWNYVNRLIETDLERYASNRYELLRLERIDQRLPQVVHWMGLNAVIIPTAKRINVGKRVPYPWLDWTAQERATFEHWCGDLMDRLYPGWRTSGGDWVGVQYSKPSGLHAKIACMHGFVRHMNALFAPNRQS
jgi:hypothetical protein